MRNGSYKRGEGAFAPLPLYFRKLQSLLLEEKVAERKRSRMWWCRKATI